VAQQIAPESRIAYVDSDPIVLSHARTLLTSSARGATTYVDTDLRDVDRLRKVAGLDLVEPGVVPLPRWRGAANPAQNIPAYAGVGRKN
jgi:hypothetical protein